MKVIIPAAGAGDRWGNHDGIPKHAATIGGVPILQRAIQRCNAADIVPTVVVRDLAPFDYQQADYVTAGPSSGSSIDKVYDSHPYWNTDGRTLVVFGDVWWSDAGFAAMLSDPGQWQVYGRMGRSRHNGRPDSLFALSIPADLHRWVQDTCLEVAELDKAGKLPRRGRLRCWYQHVTGQPLERFKIADRGHWTDIDDETDDVDSPAQLRLVRASVV